MDLSVFGWLGTLSVAGFVVFSGFAVFLVCGYCGFVAAEAGVMLLFECIVLLG